MTTAIDLRLRDIPMPWKMEGQGAENAGDNPRFVYLESGERTAFDPRLVPEALKAKGVRINDLRLV